MTGESVTLIRQPVLTRATVRAEAKPGAAATQDPRQQHLFAEEPPKPVEVTKLAPMTASNVTRTKEPLESRTERVIDVHGKRVTVTWGAGGNFAVELAEFSLNTGRMVGNRDWLIAPESLKELRKKYLVRPERRGKRKAT